MSNGLQITAAITGALTLAGAVIGFVWNNLKANQKNNMDGVDRLFQTVFEKIDKNAADIADLRSLVQTKYVTDERLNVLLGYQRRDLENILQVAARIEAEETAQRSMLSELIIEVRRNA